MKTWRRRLARWPPLRRLRDRLALAWTGLLSGPDIPGPIHPLDPFYVPGLPEHYAHAGAEAADLLARGAAELDAPPARLLDFGCGYGRVLRHLRARWPEAEVVAVDVDPEAVRFCARELGATPRVLGPRGAPEALHPPYDLAWAGSVFSHLAPSIWADRLGVLVASLRPGGVAVVTTHGPSCLEHAELYAVPPPDEPERLRGEGVLHAPYPWATDYGVTLVTEDYLRRALPEGAAVVAFEARAWDAHQDVAWIRRGPGPPASRG